MIEDTTSVLNSLYPKNAWFCRQCNKRIPKAVKESHHFEDHFLRKTAFRSTYLHSLEWISGKSLPHLLNTLLIFQTHLNIVDGSEIRICFRCRKILSEEYSTHYKRFIRLSCFFFEKKYFHGHCLEKPLSCVTCEENFTEKYDEELEIWIKCNCCAFGKDYFHKACLSDYLRLMTSGWACDLLTRMRYRQWYVDI